MDFLIEFGFRSRVWDATSAKLESHGSRCFLATGCVVAGHPRKRITDGIIGSNRVLSFLSKYSTRDPGVCRDEIAIAIGVKGGNIQTILVESEQEVKPPVNISHIQWLDMHDWKERRAASGAAWEGWYQAKLAEIIRVVESDESRRFAGEIETLNGHLKPIKSDAHIYELLKNNFFGRAWLFDAVEKWRQDAQRDSHLFWITGDPGMGKSAFAARLTHNRSDAVVAAHFIEWDKPDHRNAQRVVRSIAFQLATRLPDYRRLLLTLPEIAELDRKDPVELFDYLLANPMCSVIGGGRERYLIVIDALDEADELGSNRLVQMLARNARRLPGWLGLVVTSRPDSAVAGPLQGLNPFVLDTRTDANRDDLRNYLRHELAPQLQDRPDADQLVDQILAKSEGVYLYVGHFCDEVQHNHLSLDRPEQFPQGLGGVFFQWFQRQFPDLENFRTDVRPALRTILAAREQLPIEILEHLLNWQDEQLRDFTRSLGSLFPVSKESGTEGIKPYHKALADWLADEVKAGPYFVSVTEGHRMLAERRFADLIEEIDYSDSPVATQYWSRSLLHHCYSARDWKMVVSCIAKPRVFGTLWPGSYGVGYHEGTFIAVEPDTLSPELFEKAARGNDTEVTWALAAAFAERTRDLQKQAFSFATKYGQGTNMIRNFLEQNHPTEFLEFRDMIYSFVHLAGTAAAFAITAADHSHHAREQVKVFLDSFGVIHSYLDYLEKFARSEGWSGALEDAASVPHQSWERLRAFLT